MRAFIVREQERITVGFMEGRLFISYSRVDGGEFALRLADELLAGPPSYAAWLDVRELQPGQQDWDRQLLEAIRTCTGLLFVMSEDRQCSRRIGLQAGVGCGVEVQAAGHSGALAFRGRVTVPAQFASVRRLQRQLRHGAGAAA
jgi:hypothetical protein